MRKQQRREAMRDVAGVPTVPQEQAQQVATSSPAAPLAGSRTAGSSHGRGWRAHERRRVGWACLPPGEELAGERGGGSGSWWGWWWQRRRWWRWQGREWRWWWPWWRRSGGGGLGEAAGTDDGHFPFAAQNPFAAQKQPASVGAAPLFFYK